ncbi:fatty acid desaturase-domain-containing protein [Poronia punctata]|nr:fatty acid desaturase-domain-containing protein [Poronia punctata]
MSYVTETIHGAVVPAGELTTCKNTKLDIKTLREHIPSHCFQPSTIRSVSYVVRDVGLYIGLLYGTFYLDKNVHHLGSFCLRYMVFPYAAGTVLTGLWVLAHEAGHGAFSTNRTFADAVGFLIHSALMSPYFAWQSSHARHHQFANNLSVDLNYVPPCRDEYQTLFGGSKRRLKEEEEEEEEEEEKEDMLEDAPIVVFLRIVLQQVVGWYWYLLCHITAGPNSSPRKSRGWWDNSHFLPNSSLFRQDEKWKIVISDIGLLVSAGIIYKLIQHHGIHTILWTYILPLMWVNHWIIMITYLHHTHPSLPKYAPESWTYLRGALATVDRDPGFVLRHGMHHIVDLHVVHHLFPKIPHYHAQEATDAIKPLLGEYYHTDKSSSYWASLWEAFTLCQWVAPDAEKTAKANVYSNDDERKTVDQKGVLWYQSDLMPPPVITMRSGKRVIVE